MRLLIDQLRADRGDRALVPGGEDPFAAVPPDLWAADMLPVFVCTDAAAWYWQSIDVQDPRRGDFGPLRAPWNVSWWEWDMPDRGWVHHPLDGGEPGWRDGDGTRCGAQVVVVPTEDGALLQSFRIWITGPEARGRVMEAGTVSHMLTDTGEWAAWPDGSTDLEILFPGHVGEEMVEVYGRTIGTHAEAFLAAIGLANCRNVRADEVTVPPKVRAKRARAAGADVTPSYRVIRLPGSGGRGRARDAAGGAGELGSVRVVRGHIKHYGDDAPLFGRHVGAWWWDATARAGRARRYTVAPRADD